MAYYLLLTHGNQTAWESRRLAVLLQKPGAITKIRSPKQVAEELNNNCVRIPRFERCILYI